MLLYSFPVSDIVISAGCGLEPGQLGVGLVGWDCHWGEDNCENDGSVMFAYGLGDYVKVVGVTLCIVYCYECTPDTPNVLG